MLPFLCQFCRNPNCNNPGVTITWKYLEVGHTYMECDSAHRCIEQRVACHDVIVNVPHDYVNIIKRARKKHLHMKSDMMISCHIHSSWIMNLNKMYHPSDQGTGLVILLLMTWDRSDILQMASYLTNCPTATMNSQCYPLWKNWKLPQIHSSLISTRSHCQSVIRNTNISRN